VKFRILTAKMCALWNKLCSIPKYRVMFTVYSLNSNFLTSLQQDMCENCWRRVNIYMGIINRL